MPPHSDPSPRAGRSWLALGVILSRASAYISEKKIFSCSLNIAVFPPGKPIPSRNDSALAVKINSPGGNLSHILNGIFNTLLLIPYISIPSVVMPNNYVNRTPGCGFHSDPASSPRAPVTMALCVISNTASELCQFQQKTIVLHRVLRAGSSATPSSR